MHQFYQLSDDQLLNLKTVNLIIKGEGREVPFHHDQESNPSIVFYQRESRFSKFFKTAEERDREFGRIMEAVCIIL